MQIKPFGSGLLASSCVQNKGRPNIHARQQPNPLIGESYASTTMVYILALWLAGASLATPLVQEPQTPLQYAALEEHLKAVPQGARPSGYNRASPCLGFSAEL